MFKLFLVLSCLTFVQVANARQQDNNILSITMGQGPSGVQQSPNAGSSSSSSTTTCSSPGESDCHGNSGHSSVTNTVTNVIQGDSANQKQDAVVGLMYQRRIEDSPLLMGILIQSNQTYSVIMGVSF